MAEQAQVALNFCLKHPEEEMDLYCKICKKPTCNECLKTDHIGHDFDTIFKLYRKINNRRSDLISELETQVASKGSHNRKHLRDVKNKNEITTKTNRENIKKKRAELHQNVDALLDSHEHSLNSHSISLHEKIRENENAFERDETDVLKMMETFKKTTMKGLDLIEYYEQLKSKVHALPTVDVSHCCNDHVFVTSEIEHTAIQNLTGEVRAKTQKPFTVQQIHSFKHRTNVVHTICPLSAEESWITYTGAKKLELIRRDGYRFKKVKKETNTHSFILQNESFLLCYSDQNSILKVDMTGKLSKYMDVSPLFPRFIGYALHGNILVTLADAYTGTRTEHSQRRVQMMSPSGDILHKYEYSEDGITPVFTFPTRVVQNYNSDVCTTNRFRVREGKKCGNVCVFYEDGGLKFVYNGHGSEFLPTGLCSDYRVILYV